MRMISAIRHIAYSRSPSCQMWYQRVIEMNPPESASTTVQDTQPSTSSSRKRQWVDEEELDDSPGQFRRVRLRHIQQQQKRQAELNAQYQQRMQNGSLNLPMSLGSRLSTQSFHFVAAEINVC